LSDWEEAFSHVWRLVPYTNSAGVLLRPGSFSPREWFRDFVWNLSHDFPIDEADRSAVLFANSDLLKQARISRFLDDVTERLIQADDRTITIPNAVAGELQMPPGLGRSEQIGRGLRDHILKDPWSIFNRESRGGTWGVQLSNALRAPRDAPSGCMGDPDSTMEPA